MAVEGKLTNRSYEDKNGETHYVTEIVVNSMMMLDKKNRNLDLAEGGAAAAG